MMNSEAFIILILYFKKLDSMKSLVPTSLCETPSITRYRVM